MGKVFILKRKFVVNRLRYYYLIPSQAVGPLFWSMRYYSAPDGPYGWWSMTSGGLDVYRSYSRHIWPYFDEFDGMTDEEVDIESDGEDISIFETDEHVQTDRPEYPSPGQTVPPGHWARYFDVSPYTFDLPIGLNAPITGEDWPFKEPLQGGVFYDLCLPYQAAIYEGYELAAGGLVNLIAYSFKSFSGIR